MVLRFFFGPSANIWEQMRAVLRPMEMKYWIKVGLALSLSLISFASAESKKREITQAVLLEPASMWLISGAGDMSVVSMGYERKIPGTPYSFQLHLHGGYEARGELNSYGDTSWAAGMGLTMRRYFGESFEGSFGQIQSDYVRGESITGGYGYFNGVEYVYNGSTTLQKHMYWTTQASFGYKWQNDFFVFETSVGGAIYITQSERFTLLSVSLNVGAPF